MHHVAVAVPDLAPAIAILGLLGLAEIQRAEVPGGTMLVLLSGRVGTIELIRSADVVPVDETGTLADDLRRAGPRHPGLECDDLDATLRHLADHGHRATEPALSPYGLRFAFLRLPGGGWIELLGP